MSKPLSPEKDTPLTEGGFRYSDRAAILCRTCLRPLTWETREEPGYNPRTGWYDDARSDPLVCFKAREYRHVPLTDREWAYYEAGQRSVLSPADGDAPKVCGCPCHAGNLGTACRKNRCEREACRAAAARVLSTGYGDAS